MFKYISWIFIIVGACFLIFGGYQLYDSNKNENKRLNEAKSIISEDIVKADEKIDYEEIYNKISQGDTVGTLYIPRLDREIPIVEGTDEEQLAQGVGHYKDTGYPGENSQILLSGHRDTVFRKFGELENGDEFHIKMEHGTFIYEISDNEIVSADNTTVIDPSREDEYLTVSTCYPFSYVGSAPDRYVLYAYPK